MKVFDCFMYFDEDIICDLRLNCLDPYVDHFVIVESKFTHSGKKKELFFNINKFKKFENKIKYLILDHEPDGIETINDKDSENEKSRKYILNAAKRENYQRNYITKGLEEATPEDIILISDVDEIPKIDSLDLKKIKNKLIFFQQPRLRYLVT